MKAKRIQRKRTKGWRMPPNTVYVGRPTKWGNPFKLDGDMIYCDASHRRTIFDPWVILDNENLWRQYIGLEQVVSLYRSWLAGWFGKGSKYNGVMRPVDITHTDIQDKLRGKDLACWCPLNKPCHADVLLKIANR